MTQSLIYETVVTTVSPEGVVHVAPMGARYRECPFIGVCESCLLAAISAPPDRAYRVDNEARR